MRLTQWSCTLDECRFAKKPPFLRRDLFVAHLRRLHGYPIIESDGPGKHDPAIAAEIKRFEPIIDQCQQTVRDYPHMTRCGFCMQIFSGPKAWTDRNDHIANHYENPDGSVDLKKWTRDEYLVQWAVQEGIVIPGTLPNGQSRYTLPPDVAARGSKGKNKKGGLKPANEKFAVRKGRPARASQRRGSSASSVAQSFDMDEQNSQVDADGEDDI
jgi:hypothetical protein